MIFCDIAGNADVVHVGVPGVEAACRFGRIKIRRPDQRDLRRVGAHELGKADVARLIVFGIVRIISVPRNGGLVHLVRVADHDLLPAGVQPLRKVDDVAVLYALQSLVRLHGELHDHVVGNGVKLLLQRADAPAIVDQPHTRLFGGACGIGVVLEEALCGIAEHGSARGLIVHAVGRFFRQGQIRRFQIQGDLGAEGGGAGAGDGRVVMAVGPAPVKSGAHISRGSLVISACARIALAQMLEAHSEIDVFTGEGGEAGFVVRRRCGVVAFAAILVALQIQVVHRAPVFS